MGVITSNRKRGDDYFRSTPSLYSSDLNHRIDTHISKKARLSPMHQSRDQLVSTKSTVSRIHQYPEAAPSFRRELSAPSRRVRFGFSTRPSQDFRVNTSGVSGEEEKGDEMGNALARRLKLAKKDALGVLRYWRKDKEVIDVDEEAAEAAAAAYGEVFDDSSVEEIEVVEDGREGRSVVWSLENNGVDRANVKELDVKNVEHHRLQPSSSSVVSDLTNGNVKVENAGKMFDELSLSRQVDLDGEPCHKKLLKDMKGRNQKLSSLNLQIEVYQIKRSRPPVKKPEEDVAQEAFIALAREEEAEVSRAFSANRRKVLVTHENSNIEITGEILQCLRPGAWLNDEVINVYLELLKEREKREPKKFLKCHFFSTFFYKKLISGRNGYDFKSVKRWTTQRKLGYGLIDCEKIFVPIHKEIHWCLAVINKKDEKFQYLDSLKGMDMQVLRVLARYFVDEVKDKSGKDIDVSTWEHEYVEDLPEQENGSDCGVFMIKYADFYSRGVGLCFNQGHMPYFRLRTAKEILRLKAD